METVIERNIDFAAQAADPLWERFQKAEDPVKGDILYMLGEIGDEMMIPKLEDIITEISNNELRETAGEAIDRIKERRFKDNNGEDTESVCNLGDSSSFFPTE